MDQSPSSTRLLARNPEAPGSEAFHQTLLDSGLRILVESCPIPHTAAAALWFEAGSRHDGPDSNGLAHLVEHAVFRRTEALGQFGVELESLGADIDATTEREAMSYSIYSYYNLYLETGSLAICAATRPAACADAVHLVAEECRRIAAQTVAEDELALARSKLRRNLRFNMERVELRATRVVKEAVWNDRYFDQEVDP